MSQPPKKRMTVVKPGSTPTSTIPAPAPVVSTYKKHLPLSKSIIMRITDFTSAANLLNKYKSCTGSESGLRELDTHLGEVAERLDRLIDDLDEALPADPPSDQEEDGEDTEEYGADTGEEEDL